MRTLILVALCMACSLVACKKSIIEVDTTKQTKTDSVGILDIHFIYNVQGIASDKAKRADLSLAYNADSLYRGEFFRSTNVSDAVTKYRFYLPTGTYYYQATIICLGDENLCKYAKFPGGQYGLRMDGGKVEIEANKTTEITTQFH